MRERRHAAIIKATLAGAVALALKPLIASADLKDTVFFDVPAQQLPSALNRYSEQAGVQVTSSGQLIERKLSSAISGRLAARAALDLLLKDTRLRFDVIDDKTVVIMPERSSAESGVKPGISRAGREGTSIHLAQSAQADLPAARGYAAETDSSASVSAAASESRHSGAAVAIPEILVQGNRSLNTDIRRSRDDIQPYVVLERKAIEKSGARNLEDFMREQVTLFANASTGAQIPGASITNSRLNLRGLGDTQTLILIDGRRAPTSYSSGLAGQADLNSVPLAAIERIEILANTASGIYGGSATGGVINVILRRDYTGGEVKLTYGSALDGAGATRRADLTAGLTLPDEKTSVMLTGSYADANPLLAGERDFARRQRQSVLENNPATFFQAFYPLVGSTTNIRSTSGNLSLRDGRPLNSPYTYVPVGYAGPQSDGGAAFLNNAGTYNLELPDTAQSNGSARAGLLGAPEMKSIGATLRRPLTDRVDAFVELFASDNAASQPGSAANSTFFLAAGAPANPFRQSIRISTPAYGADSGATSLMKSRRGVAGVTVQLPAQWSAAADFTWSRATSSSRLASELDGVDANGFTANQAIASGALNVFSDNRSADFSPYLTDGGRLSPVRTQLRSSAIRLSGPVYWPLPLPTPTLSAVIERRKETVGDSYVFQSSAELIYPSRWQSVDSAYLEARVPLVHQDRPLPGAQRLELQLAARGDVYRNTGANTIFIFDGIPDTEAQRATNRFSSVNPTLGLRWKPVRDAMLRMSYGTGFVPPSLGQVVPGAPGLIDAGTAATLGVIDPVLGQVLQDYTLYGGGNPNLNPEESESWSAGIVLTPRVIPGLRFSVDWTRIEKTDNIGTLSPHTRQQDLQLLIDYAPERVIREAAPAGQVGRIIGLVSGYMNLAQARVQAYDFSLDYTTPQNAWGTLNFAAAATRQVDNIRVAFPGGTEVENNGVYFANPKWTAHGALTWVHRQWSMGWSTHYYGSSWFYTDHRVNLDLGAARIDEQVYHDLTASYRVEESSGAGLLSGLTVNAGIKNIFDTEPPLTYTEPFYSTWADPRLAQYFLSLTKSF